MSKDCNRGDRENCREDDATVAINFLGAFRLLIVIEDRRHQNFDQGKVLIPLARRSLACLVVASREDWCGGGSR